MMQKGYRRKLAYDEEGKRVGLLEYMPIEEALECVDGEHVNVLHCLVDMIGYHGGSDATRALLQATEE